MDINDLGFSKEEILDRLIERVSEEVLTTIGWDGDGECRANSTFKKKLDKLVLDRIDESVKAIAEEHVLPHAKNYIENITIKKTNQYGEEKGESITFIEYLTNRADDYLNQKVDGRGNISDSYGRNSQTRIAYLVDEHLDYSIKKAMTSALKTANDSIIGGLKTAVEMQLNEINKKLKIQVKL